ncbi:MAG: hypothetical protein EBU90_26550 [Proteobacteria bacterium]|nr:hypothetical protein [Pseudomonadota bacterium]
MVNHNRFYTYAYLREDKTPYYIGKGSGKRIYDTDGRPCKKPKNKSRIIFLKKNLTEKEAFKHEKYMISVFGRKDLGTGILHNKTDGGEGVSGFLHSEEAKRKISEVNKGKKLTANHKKKISESNKGKSKTITEKSKQSVINRAKARTGIYGYKHSEETKIKISKATKGRVPWNKGIKNPNITGSKSPAAKKIYYNGNIYGSILDAIKTTGKSYYCVKKYGKIII